MENWKQIYFEILLLGNSKKRFDIFIFKNAKKRKRKCQNVNVIFKELNGTGIL